MKRILGAATAAYHSGAGAGMKWILGAATARTDHFPRQELTIQERALEWDGFQEQPWQLTIQEQVLDWNRFREQPQKLAIQQERALEWNGFWEQP
jgi:hypothetical protein